MAFYWIQSAYNFSDMLSKHWDHPTVYPMILKLLITRGNITLIPKRILIAMHNENEADCNENFRIHAEEPVAPLYKQLASIGL